MKVSIVAENTKQIAKEKGIKHSYIAEKMGISQNALSNMLNGRTNIYADHIVSICQILKVKPNDLFRKED